MSEQPSFDLSNGDSKNKILAGGFAKPLSEHRWSARCMVKIGQNEKRGGSCCPVESYNPFSYVPLTLAAKVPSANGKLKTGITKQLGDNGFTERIFYD
jgi:hypothetical protein